jgi:HEAT repeats
MPRRKSVDDRLAELEAEIEAADPAGLSRRLERALADRHCLVVALAARHTGERLFYACIPALLGAYARFLDQPVKRDPGCIAKKAIMRALYELDCDDAPFFLDALRYRQPEPVWGGTSDTAIDLRCTAAMGLVASGYPRALAEVAGLLVDEEAQARAGAARAIACGNPREAELLLRLKASVGDDDAFVLGECFEGLLTVEPDESVAFVAGYLDADDDAVREAAAHALGESRLPAALDRLQTAWNEAYVPDWWRRVLVRAAAVHRSDAAFDWLLALVAESPARTAGHVIETLAIYAHNARLAERVSQVVEVRGDAALDEAFAAHWQR